jgi:hypothetical protein
MSLSIHYSGNFRKGTSLNEMINEVTDIATLSNWKYFIFERQFPEHALGKRAYNNKLYGISFSLPKSEPIFLCFLSNGMMSSPVNLQFHSVYAVNPNNEYLGLLSTKTQFAGLEAHKTIIGFIDYIAKKYIDDFSLIDEGRYWETRDEKLLQKTFDDYNKYMDLFAIALENIPQYEDESTENFIKRVYSKIRDIASKNPE